MSTISGSLPYSCGLNSGLWVKGKESRGELKVSLCSRTLEDSAEDLKAQELGGHVILSVEVGAKESFCLPLAGTDTCTVGMKRGHRSPLSEGLLLQDYSLERVDCLLGNPIFGEGSFP